MFSLDGSSSFFAVGGACLAVGIFLGGYVTYLYHDRAYQEYAAEAQAKLNEAQQELIEQERTAQQQVRQIEIKGEKEKRDIENKFNATVTNLNDELNRLRINNSRSTNNPPPNARVTTGNVSPCKCEPLRTNERIVGSLEIARDCDLLAIRYNQLLQIYNSLKEVNNNGN